MQVLSQRFIQNTFGKMGFEKTEFDINENLYINKLCSVFVIDFSVLVSFDTQALLILFKLLILFNNSICVDAQEVLSDPSSLLMCTDVYLYL